MKNLKTLIVITGLLGFANGAMAGDCAMNGKPFLNCNQIGNTATFRMSFDGPSCQQLVAVTNYITFKSEEISFGEAAYTFGHTTYQEANSSEVFKNDDTLMFSETLLQIGEARLVWNRNGGRALFYCK